MGGQDGNRGYVYQGLACVFTALSDDSWDKISVEYSTPNDKVDIALVDCDDIVLKAIQVKSSVNLFTKSDIQTWILSLAKDVSASEYQLMLIGGLQESANIFVKSVAKYYKGVIDKETQNSIKGFESHLKGITVKIVVLPFDEENLMSIVRDSLNRFVSKKGHTINFDELEELSLALLSLKMLLGTNGELIAKNGYEKKMLSWLDSSTNGKFLNTSIPSALEIFTYDTKIHKKTNDFTAYGIIHNLGFLCYKKNCLSKGNSLISDIKKIELNPFQETVGVEKDNVYNFSKSVKAEFNEVTKDDITKSIKKYWCIDISPSFYNIGNLTRSDLFAQLTGPSFNGTNEEKNKYDLICELMTNIHTLNGMEHFIDAFKAVRMVPLCISNNGTTSDKNISVSISVRGENYRPFDFGTDIDNDSLELLDVFADILIDEEVLERIFDVKPNSSIDVEPQPSYDPTSFVMPDMFGRRRTYKLDDLEMQLSEYQAEENPVGWATYEISTLRPGESKWLSPFVFFIIDGESDKVTLNYSILSESSQGKRNGTIVVTVSN